MNVTNSFVQWLEKKLEEVRQEICEGVCNNAEMAMLEAEERDLEDAIDAMTNEYVLEMK